MFKALIAFILVVILPAGLVSAQGIRTGRFEFTDWDGPALTIHYVEPALDDLADAPVVIVMHGVNRNADDYRDNWRDLARRYGLRVYAPEFSSREFPGAALYNLGGVGTDGPFAYSAIEPLFQAIATRGGTPGGYHLFGHSAGAQFVHRALLFEDLPHLIRAYSANAGWYTLPDATIDWPYGLQGVEGVSYDMGRWLQSPMTVMLGDADTDPDDPNLRRTPEAMVQGPHRYARGAYFMGLARDRAGELGVPFAWDAFRVPDVAHDNAGMAQAAAYLIDYQRTAEPVPQH